MIDNITGALANALGQTHIAMAMLESIKIIPSPIGAADHYNQEADHLANFISNVTMNIESALRDMNQVRRIDAENRRKIEKEADQKENEVVLQEAPHGEGVTRQRADGTWGPGTV